MANITLPPARRRERRWPRWLALLVLLLAAAGLYRLNTVKPAVPGPFLAGPTPLILAHQGASGYAPSNTLEAFQLALDQGADILELDVHMSKDGHLIVAHDDTVDRLTDGQGAIKELTLVEIKALDAGYAFTPDGGQTYPYRGKGVTIPTLDEVIAAFPGVRLNIEIKQHRDPVLQERLWATIQQHQLYDLVLVNSFDAETTEQFRKLSGGRVALGAGQGDVITFVIFQKLGLGRLWQPPQALQALQLPTEQLGINLATKGLLKAANGQGVHVHYWTINDEDEMRRLLELGAQGLITDYPDRALKVMRELGLR